MLFECSLPKHVPTIYHPAIYQKLQDTVDLVYARTDKLNKALAKSGMPFASFHKAVKSVFDIFKEKNPEKFDRMTPTQLAKMAISLDDGEPKPEFMEWPNAVVMYDTAFVTTRDWEALRHFGIGGSDSSVVMGISHFNTREGLWFDKTGYPVLKNDLGRQAIFDRGHFLEDRVIDTFCHMTGAVRIPETRMFRSKAHPNTTANIDAIVRMPNGDLAIFEAKTTIDEYNTVSRWFGDRVPDYYVTQVHQYISVLDDPRIKGGYIGCIPTKDVTVAGTYMGSEVSKDFFHSFIEKDPAREEEILEAEEEFWNTYVVPGVKPEPSKVAELDKAVADKFKPSPLTATVEAQSIGYEENADLIARLLDAEDELKEWDQRGKELTNLRDTLRLELIEKLNGAATGSFVNRAGEKVFTVKNVPIRKRSIDAKALEEFFPDAYKKCVKTSEYTRFSIKELAK